MVKFVSHPLGFLAVALFYGAALVSLTIVALRLWDIHVNGGILAYYGL